MPENTATTQAAITAAAAPRTAQSNSPQGTQGAQQDYEAKLKEAEKKRKETERELAQARSAIEQHARAQNTEVENMKADYQKMQERVEAFEDFKYTTFLQMAIMRDSRYQWQDGAVEDVMAACDPDVVKIDDEGNIEGLDDALKQIAEKKPYLLKPVGGTVPAQNVVAPTTVSGSHPAGSPGGNADFDTAYLKKKYKIA